MNSVMDQSSLLRNQDALMKEDVGLIPEYPFFLNPVNHQLLMSLHAGLLQELIQGWCCFPDSALLPSLPSAKQGGLSLTEIN